MSSGHPFFTGFERLGGVFPFFSEKKGRKSRKNAFLFNPGVEIS